MIRYNRKYPKLFSSLWGGFKLAVDGGGRTSLWYGNHHALPLHKTEELHKMVKLFHRSGHQVSVHVSGDEAVDLSLDAIEAALKEHPRENHRHRIEHVISPQTNSLERMKSLGVVVSTHPQWFFAWFDKSNWLKKREDKNLGVIPLKSYLQRGIPIAMGADPPAYPIYQPQVAIWEAVARVTQKGYSYNSAESISIQAALRTQTMGSAYAGFQEEEIGSIEKEKLADMVIWNKDFYTIPQDRIKDVKAEITILGGKVVYRSNNTDLY